MQDEIKNYSDLVVWQRAMDLAPEVYQVCRMLPVEERFALADQLRRSVVSVAANIAEGQGRNGPKEFAHFLGIARGSLAELHTLLIFSNRLGYVTSDSLSDFSKRIEAIRRPLFGLLQAIGPRKSVNREP